MQAVYEQVAQVAPTNTTVLIRGESGTGKELVAHAIHYNSPRAEQAVRQGELRGAAREPDRVRAVRLRAGRLHRTRARRRRAASSWPTAARSSSTRSASCRPPTQVKLLRVLQEREFERLGGDAADQGRRAPDRRHQQGPRGGGASRARFREDLYYRLNVFTHLPARRCASASPTSCCWPTTSSRSTRAAHGKDVRRIATTAIDMLMSYHWPGNVRELENCIERAVLVCEGGVDPRPPPAADAADRRGLGHAAARARWRRRSRPTRRTCILDALKTARGNRAKAARLLDTTERIVGYKVRKYGIDAGRFRGESRWPDSRRSCRTPDPTSAVASRLRPAAAVAGQADSRTRHLRGCGLRGLAPARSGSLLWFFPSEASHCARGG